MESSRVNVDGKSGFEGPASVGKHDEELVAIRVAMTEKHRMDTELESKIFHRMLIWLDRAVKAYTHRSYNVKAQPITSVMQ